MARWLQDQGNDGLVVAGTTGEAPVLSEAEKLDLWRAVSEAVTIPVVAGTGTNNTAETVELTRRAGECGAAGVLVVGPYYNRPSQAGIEAHFRAVAAATTLPVVVYDVPGRTGRRISRDVLVRLFRDVGNIVGFKDATGDAPGSAALVAALGDVDRRLQRRRRHDAAAARLRHRRRHRRQHALGDTGVPRAVRGVGQGRRHRRPRGQRPAAGVLRLRQQRHVRLLAVGEGGAAGARAAGGRVPPPAGAGAGRHRATGRGRCCRPSAATL